MIVALDIETIPNADMIDKLPDPKIRANLKDPDKIETAKREGRQKQVDTMALDPLTARVACYSLVDGNEDHIETIPEINDIAEINLIHSLMRMLSDETVRIVTWNGISFDLPMIYKRAMILGVSPANFGAPPLTTWTKRYNIDRHFDLMKIWTDWKGGSDGYAKLDTVAGMVIGANKTDFDVMKIAELLLTEEGRNQVGQYCLQDTRLTWELWKRFSGTLFA